MSEPKKIRVEVRRTEHGGLHYNFDCDKSPAPPWEPVFSAEIDMETLRRSEYPENHVAELLMEAICAGVHRGRSGDLDDQFFPVYPVGHKST